MGSNSNVSNSNFNQQFIDLAASQIEAGDLSEAELKSLQDAINTASQKLNQARSQEANSNTTNNVNASAMSDVEALLEGDTIEEQVQNFKKDTRELHRKSDLKLADVEQNSQLADLLNSNLETMVTSFARRSRRQIGRSQDYLEKKLVKDTLKAIARKAGTLIQADSVVDATDIEQLQNDKQEINELVEKHEDSFFVKHHSKNANKNLSMLKKKFIMQFKPDMNDLTQRMSELTKSGNPISDEQYKEFVGQYEILHDKFGEVNHPNIRKFKEMTEASLKKLESQIEGPIRLPPIKPGPGQGYPADVLINNGLPRGPFLEEEATINSIDETINTIKDTKTPHSDTEANFDQQVLMDKIQSRFAKIASKASFSHQDEIRAKGGTISEDGMYHMGLIPYNLVGKEGLDFIMENTQKLFEELGDNPAYKNFFDNVSNKLNQTKGLLAGDYGRLIPVTARMDFPRPGQPIDGPFPNPGFPQPGLPLPGPIMPEPGPILIDPVNPNDMAPVPGLNQDQVFALFNMPRTSSEEMSNYVNALKELSGEIKTGVMISSSNVNGPYEADIFSPHTFLNHFNGGSENNEVLKQLMDSGILDINNDGKTDSLDYYSLMKGSNKTTTASDFEGLVNAPQVNETTANEYKSMPRASSEDVANYIEKMHADHLNLSLYGGVQVNDLGQDEGRYLQDLVNGNNRSGNPRAQEAFDAGIYDFNNDGITDEKDVQILNRFTSGNKDFDGLLAPIDQQPGNKSSGESTKAQTSESLGEFLAEINDTYPGRTVIPSTQDIENMKILYESMPDVIHQIDSNTDSIDEDFLNSMSGKLYQLHENLKGDTRFDKFFEFASEQLANYQQVLNDENSVFSAADGSATNENASKDRGPRNLEQIMEYAQIFNPVFDIDGDGETSSKDQMLIYDYLNDPDFIFNENIHGGSGRTEAEIRSQLDILFNTFNILDINNDGQKNTRDAKILELLQLLNSLN